MPQIVSLPSARFMLSQDEKGNFLIDKLGFASAWDAWDRESNNLMMHDDSSDSSPGDALEEAPAREQEGAQAGDAEGVPSGETNSTQMQGRTSTQTCTAGEHSKESGLVYDALAAMRLQPEPSIASRHRCSRRARDWARGCRRGAGATQRGCAPCSRVASVV